MLSIWDYTNIRAARKDAGLTAEIASDMLKITPEYLSMLENGHRQPSQKLVARMSTLYRKPASYFLKDEKNLAFS